MRRLFMRVYSSDEHYDADCSFAVICVTEELVARYKAHLEKIKALCAKDENGLSDGFAHASWWDYDCCFIKGGMAIEEAFGEEIQSQLYDGVHYVEPHTFAPVEFETVRMEGDKVVMDGSGVWWEATPKHSSITLSTDRINLADLFAIIDKPDLETPWDKNSSGSSSKDPTS